MYNILIKYTISSIRILVRLALILQALICVQGCGKISNSSLVTTCVLPSDQSATLRGHWATLAVPIAISQSGNYSAYEANAVTAAASTWNSFFSTSKQISAIDYGGNPGSPRVSSIPKPTDLCAQSILQNGKYSSPVVIYKDGTWPHTDVPLAIALTTYCTNTSSTTSGSSKFYQAITELNYQNFFVAGKQQPDLQSILLHEMGHLLGLGHSCEPSSQTNGVPNCGQTGLPPSYASALMFPTFSFNAAGQGQAKQQLQSNDEGRMNCLY